MHGILHVAAGRGRGTCDTLSPADGTPSEHGLRRSVGVSGLFATAYGNVGSSIYYALGLVAAHALGLTPLVFVFAGGLFALTAKTYAEGAAMFPEAGGSSSFARHAFDDVVSFFAGWALSLDYILTIAISAFFVPHYLSAFPGLHALNHNPDDIFGGLIVVVLLAALNIRGLGESAKLNFVLAILDLSTQILLVGIGAVLVLNPSLLVHQVQLGSVPTWKELIFALSLAMLAYTGIETVANMAEEARDPGRQVPKAVNLVVLAVLGVYAGISVVALSALPVIHHGVGYSAELKQLLTTPGYATALGGYFQNDPVLGIIERLGPARHGAETRRVLRRDPRRDDPVHRHQRGHDRDLAPVLVAGRAPPAAEPVLAAAPEVPHALVHADVLLRARRRADPVRQHRSARQPLLVRRDALVHDRARGGDRAARQGPRPRTPLPDAWNVRIRGAQIPMTAVLGGIGTSAAWVAVAVLHTEARYVGIPWMIFGMAGYFLYRKRQGLDPRKDYRIERAERPADFEELDYRTALVPIFGEDVSASALTSAAKLIGEDGVVYAIYVLPVPEPAVAGGGPGGGGGEGRSVLESARIQARRAGYQDPHGPDPHAQPRLGARRGSRTGRLGRDLLVDDPCPRGRAADRPDRRLPAQQAPLPGHHRDREPPARSRRRCARRASSRALACVRSTHAAVLSALGCDSGPQRPSSQRGAQRSSSSGGGTDSRARAPWPAPRARPW